MLVKKELLQMPEQEPFQILELPRSGRIMNVNCYRNKELRVRFFSDGTNYIFFYQTTKNWSLQNYFGKYSYTISLDFPTEVNEEPTNVNMARALLFGTGRFHDDWRGKYSHRVTDLINDFIYSCQLESREKQYDKKIQLRESHFFMFPPLSEDYKQWYHDKLFADQQYLFFSNKQKDGSRKVHCSTCGAEYQEQKTIRHKETGVCQHCGAKVLYIAELYAESRESKRRACFCSKREDAYLFETVEVIQSFDTNRQVHYRSYPIQYFLYWPGKEKRKVYSYTYKNIMYSGYDWFRTIDRRSGMTATVYTDNLDSVFSELHGKELKHTIEQHRSEICMSSLILNLKTIPQTEYLVKMGLLQLAAKAEHVTFYDGKGFAGVMGVDPTYKELYKRVDPTVSEHQYIQRRTEIVSAESVLQARELYKEPCYYLLEELRSRFGITLKSVVWYLKRLDLKESNDTITCKWMDYLGMAQTLGFHMENEAILFPKNPLVEHDRLVKLMRAEKEEREKEQRQKEAELFAKEAERYTNLAQLCSSKEYVIKIPHEYEDLRREGMELHHCVGQLMYWDRHRTGQSIIFFIRKREAEDTPYFTCEITTKSYRIAQLYGMKDCHPNNEIRLFAEKFLRMVRPAEKKAVQGGVTDGKK